MQFKVTVKSEEDKQKILAQSKYIHDHFCTSFDSDYCNDLMHLYLCPDLLIVDNDLRLD